MLIEPHWLSGSPTSKVVGEIPRHCLSVADVKRAIMTTVTLSIAGEDKGLQLKFAAIDKQDVQPFLQSFGPVAV